MALKHATALVLAALALAVPLAAQGTRVAYFVPPRLVNAELPPLPAPNIAGGGEVLIEGIVDRRGVLTRPMTLRATPPYTQFILDAIVRWRFEPARDIDYKGVETTVEMPVTIMAIYRPPVLMNTPTIGEPPKDLMKPSGDVAHPTATAMPNYPPLARDGGVVLFEVALNEAGSVTETRGVASLGGFESTSREALASWRFKGGLYRARPVPSTAYVLFGFRPPVGGQSPCVPNDDRPQCRPLKPGAAVSPPSFGILSFR
jgi:hypothetical protein